MKRIPLDRFQLLERFQAHQEQVLQNMLIEAEEKRAEQEALREWCDSLRSSSTVAEVSIMSEDYTEHAARIGEPQGMNVEGGVHIPFLNNIKDFSKPGTFRIKGYNERYGYYGEYTPLKGYGMRLFIRASFFERTIGEN